MNSLAPSLAAEQALATAKGWTNIIDAGGVLLGTPPEGAPDSRGQAAVPCWARSWEACGPLMLEYGLIWMLQNGVVFAGDHSGKALAATGLDEHAGINAAVRYAFVQAATVKALAYAVTQRMSAPARGVV